ncbi:MAG: DUF6804 family protein [Phycisphaeraceae bacterium]
MPGNESDQRSGFPWAIVLPCALSAALCFLALGPQPYNFYRVLRLVVCVSALWCGYRLWAMGEARTLHSAFVGVGLVGFAITALLFNPLLPLHFVRSTWAVLDVMTGAWFIAVGGALLLWWLPTKKGVL